MALQLYNTLTRTTQEFAPLAPPAVTMYVCGPTVYDDPHIGHARSAFIFDVVRRYLESKGLQVRFVRNVTDVDDKIIERARQESKISATMHGGSAKPFGGQNPKSKIPDLRKACEEVAERYLNSYHEAMDRLGIRRPDLEPKATDHVVPDMTDFIAKLLVNGVAYEADGDVYFSVRKCEGYGRLSNRTLDELQVGTRVEPGEQKRDPLDFALWKAAKPGEPSWKSPWGEGRPGWHIECSTMSTKYLGEAFDIHGGGVDLVFPHHENEIAQAQAAGKPFAKYWVHNGLLTVNGEKMSKSLGNFITVDQALAACDGESDALKMFFLGAHYRSPIDYSERSVKAALGRYRRMANFYHRIMNMDYPTETVDLPHSPNVFALHDEFINAMDDDLNTPKALAALDRLIAEGYAASDRLYRFEVVDMILRLGKTLGLFRGLAGVQLNHEQQQLLHKREEARKRRDFTAADQIRAVFATQGLDIEDTLEGPVVLPKN